MKRKNSLRPPVSLYSVDESGALNIERSPWQKSVVQGVDLVPLPPINDGYTSNYSPGETLIFFGALSPLQQ